MWHSSALQMIACLASLWHIECILLRNGIVGIFMPLRSYRRSVHSKKPHIGRHSTPGFLVFLCHKLYFPDKQKNVIFMKIRNLSFVPRQKTLYLYILAIFLLQNSCNFADENKPLGMLCLRDMLAFLFSRC